MKLVFATHNANKFSEVKALLPRGLDLLSLHDIGLIDEIPETGNTLHENALLKANFVTEKCGFDCFADDTGLLVDALDGEPGVYSARYAGPQKNDAANMQKLLSALEGITNRKAQFKTIFALNLEGESYIFEGTVHGEIIEEKRGDKGFGYDPIFKPEGYDKTFAELSMKTKNQISHRGKAMKRLIDFLEKLQLQSPK